MSLSPSERKTSSKAALNLVSRSRSRNLTFSPPSCSFQARFRACWANQRSRSRRTGPHLDDAQLISPMNDIGVVDPNIDPRTNDAPVPFRVGNGIPAPAIDPESGDLYVVWEDVRFTGQDETVITRSTKGGATWSSPKRVNTPGGPAFTPVVAVTDSGSAGVARTVGVTYHQLGASSSGLSPTTYFIKRFSAVAAGDSSSVDTGVAANTVFGPFNILDAPLARGYSSATRSPC
jgi:hypothetical protein